VCFSTLLLENTPHYVPFYGERVNGDIPCPFKALTVELQTFHSLSQNPNFNWNRSTWRYVLDVGFEPNYY
jgi:hypothetical protein